MNRRAFLAVLAACSAPALAQAPDPLAGRFGGPFSLTAHDGRTLADTDFRGRFMLVYFGYTHCPDLCPEDLSVTSAALNLLGDDAARIQPLFITVDPGRDTQAVLAAYVESFHPSLIGLTGSEAEIAAAAKAYRVHRRKVAPNAAAKDQAGYLVDHSSLAYLMGPDGAFRTLIPHGADAARLAAILRKYLAAG